MPSYERINPCPMCGTADDVEIRLNDTWRYEATDINPTYEVEGIHCYYCTVCHEKYTNLEMGRHNHPLNIDALRKAKGLLTSDQLTTLSTTLGASEAEIESVLGFGPRTFSRWKNARVCQSESHNALLYAVMRDNELFFELAESRHIPIAGRRRGRPKKKPPDNLLTA